MRRSKPDGGLTNEALKLLALNPHVWDWRENSGTIMVQSESGPRIYRGAPAGTPDIIGYLCRPGYLAAPFAIETKSARGTLNIAQRAWHAKARVWNLPVCVARSLSDVVRFIKEIERG